MSIAKEIIAELTHESANTRKMLERIPTNKLDWSIHEKSMKLGKLATHIAEIPVWVNRITDADSFDFATANFNLEGHANTEAILEEFDRRLAEALASLENFDDQLQSEIWTAKSGDTIFYQLPKKVALRNFALNHLYHHRGQLSVYLRLLGIPVPGMYGPSADER